MPVNVAGGRRWLDASRTGTGTAGTAALALRARVMELRQALVLAMVQPALPAPALYWPLAQSLHVPGAPPPQPECDEPAAQV